MKIRTDKTEPGSSPAAGHERRKDLRLPTPTGLWVSWKFEKKKHTSRVLDFSASGAFIVTHEILAVGTPLNLIFAMIQTFLKNSDQMVSQRVRSVLCVLERRYIC